MNRRRFLSTLTAGPVLAAVLAGCGDPDAVPAGTTPTTTAATGAPTSPPPAAQIEHPTGRDEVVFRIRYENGFVPTSVAFERVPSLLVSGDGRLFRPGPQIAIYPGPLLPAITVASITEGGVQRLLGAVRAAGLLGEPIISDGSENETQVADAADTTVLIAAGGTTVEHRAYALGTASISGDGESTPERQRLLDFVGRTDDLAALVGADQVGEEQPFDAAAYRLRAVPVSPDRPATGDPAPTVAPWPTETGVRLAGASSCVLVSGSVVAETLRAANSLSWFTEDGITYELNAVQLLPGESCP